MGNGELLVVAKLRAAKQRRREKHYKRNARVAIFLAEHGVWLHPTKGWRIGQR